MSWMSWLDRLSLDLRHTVRVLQRAPVFTAVAVLSIALGIGANTAIFSILYALLLRPLPVQAPRELVQVTFGRGSTAVTNPIWEYLRDHQTVLARSFAWATVGFDLSTGGRKQIVSGLYTSGDLFDALGVRAVTGRTLDRADDRPGGGAHGPVAMISYRYWQVHYRGSADAVGSPLRLDGQLFTIVGVVQPDFVGLDVGRPFDVAVPIAAEAIVRGPDSMLAGRGTYWLKVGGRLKPAQRMAQAEAGLRAMMPGLREAMQAGRQNPSIQTPGRPNRFLAQELSLRSAATGGLGVQTRYGPVLMTLMGTVALVLLIACANLANLLLARATARQKEFALRLALGASRGRLLRQLLLESLCLAIAGAALGLLFAQWAAHLVVTQIATRRLPIALDLSLDWPVLGFASAVALITALVFGLVPALRSTDLSANDVLKQQGRSLAGGWRGFTTEKLLVGVQIAVSLVLVFGALLFVRTFASLATLDTGFDRRQVLLVRLDTSRMDASPARRAAMHGQVLEAARSLPGVQDASLSRFTPISGVGGSYYLDVDGFTPTRDADAIVHFNTISPDYFRTLGMPLLAGRAFDADDTRTAPDVAVVNETFARTFFHGASPVGRTFRGRGDRATVQIIGLVKDSKNRSLRDPVPPMAYVPVAQDRDTAMDFNLLLRTSADATTLVGRVTTMAREIEKGLGLEFSTLQAQVDESLAQERLIALLSGFFGALALLVAGIGLYGVMSLAVSRRRHEIGIRMALGAEPVSVVRLVLRDVLIVTGIGLTVGALAGLSAGKYVATLLFGLAPTDVTTWVVATAVLGGVAACAGYLPARRAARVDPMLALREE